jgi:UDP:flavonoid glycosyltransferase YjiC (YdhE family)
MKHISFVFGLGDVEKEMENVLFLPWLPQNDLLGHPKTKLFITHCGKNGIFEALKLIDYTAKRNHDNFF